MRCMVSYRKQKMPLTYGSFEKTIWSIKTRQSFESREQIFFKMHYWLESLEICKYIQYSQYYASDLTTALKTTFQI